MTTKKQSGFGGGFIKIYKGFKRTKNNSESHSRWFHGISAVHFPRKFISVLQLTVPNAKGRQKAFIVHWHSAIDFAICIG
jgi:hypothetical protein